MSHQYFAVELVNLFPLIKIHIKSNIWDEVVKWNYFFVEPLSDPSRRFRCHLRVKVKGGEGTLPLTARRANQRQERASTREPFVAMSCTDKMAKWVQQQDACWYLPTCDYRETAAAAGNLTLTSRPPKKEQKLPFLIQLVCFRSRAATFITLPRCFQVVCLLRWSVVGLQGALLSRLVEPVYLHSLTVGTLAHTGHLGRAMARRLAPVKHLPFPYRRQQLLLGCKWYPRLAEGFMGSCVRVLWRPGALCSDLKRQVTPV